MLSTEWIGRHFIVTKDHSKSRLYTNCTMLDAGIVKWRDNLIKMFENLVENKKHDILDISYPEETKNLPLIIKTYQGQESLSLNMSKSSINDKWIIEGPIVIFFEKINFFNLTREMDQK